MNQDGTGVSNSITLPYNEYIIRGVVCLQPKSWESRKQSSQAMEKALRDTKKSVN